MDEFLQGLINQAPNLMFAALFCYWMMKRIEARDDLLFALVRHCYGIPDENSKSDTEINIPPANRVQ